MDLRKEFEKETGNKPSYQPYMGRGGETFTSDYVNWLEAKAGQHETFVMRIDTALDDWIRTYAPEFCDKNNVDESLKRISDNGGTLAYIAGLKEELSKLIA